MKIKVQQCLHGYSNGHQLLANSVELSLTARRTLLFQSDLSGPKITNGFESYLTGYPLGESRYYVLAKTWYAAEMPRPGCVWTHSLLIEFADLGKIPDMSALLNLFQRPENDDYDYFKKELLIDSFSLLNRSQSVYLNDYNSVAKDVYMHPTQSIILESQNSERYEKAVLELWSDQWPRLRRNFLFCTGALSLKAIESRLFDVQVIPAKNKPLVSRNFQNLKFVDFDCTELPSWLELIHSTNKNQLREFFWTFGADMAGERANYIKLVELYKFFNGECLNINILNERIKLYLPKPEIGKAFKNSIFGVNPTATHLSKKEILRFLLQEADLNHLNIEDYNLTTRLTELYKSKCISIYELADMILMSQPNRLEDSIYDVIEITSTEVGDVFEKYNFLIGKLISNNVDLAYSGKLWFTDRDTQRVIIDELTAIYSHEFPKAILYNILEARSTAIFDLEQRYGAAIVVQSLYWYNNNSGELLTSWRDYIFDQHLDTFIEWFRNNLATIHSKVFIDIFQGGRLDWVMRLPISYEEWVISYSVLRNIKSVNLPYIASLFLSKGLQNTISGSEWIVNAVFNDVYQFAKHFQLSNYWNLIPKDFEDYEDQDNSNPFGLIFAIMGIRPTQKNKTNKYEDYCKVIIMTVSTKFYKNNWSQQAYLDTFNSPITFRTSIAYMLSKRRGYEYISKVKYNLSHSRSIKARTFQIELMSQ